MKPIKRIALNAMHDGVQDKNELESWLIMNCGTKCILSTVWNELTRLFNYRELLIKKCIYS